MAFKDWSKARKAAVMGMGALGAGGAGAAGGAVIGHKKGKKKELKNRFTVAKIRNRKGQTGYAIGPRKSIMELAQAANTKDPKAIASALKKTLLVNNPVKKKTSAITINMDNISMELLKTAAKSGRDTVLDAYRSGGLTIAEPNKAMEALRRHSEGKEFKDEIEALREKAFKSGTEAGIKALSETMADWSRGLEQEPDPYEAETAISFAKSDILEKGLNPFLYDLDEDKAKMLAEVIRDSGGPPDDFGDALDELRTQKDNTNAQKLLESVRSGRLKGSLVGGVPGALTGGLLGLHLGGGVGAGIGTLGGVALGGLPGFSIGGRMGFNRKARSMLSDKEKVSEVALLKEAAKQEIKEELKSIMKIAGIGEAIKNLPTWSKYLGTGLISGGVGAGLGVGLERQNRFKVMNSPIGVLAGEKDDLEDFKEAFKEKNRKKLHESMSRVVPVDRGYARALVGKQRALNKRKG